MAFVGLSPRRLSCVRISGLEDKRRRDRFAGLRADMWVFYVVKLVGSLDIGEFSFGCLCCLS